VTECRRRHCVAAEEVSFPCHFAPHLRPAPRRSLFPDRKSAEEEAGQNPNACFHQSLNNSSIHAQLNRKATHDMSRREIQWRTHDHGDSTEPSSAAARAWKDTPGLVVKWCSVNLDITYRRRTCERSGWRNRHAAREQVSRRKFARPTAIDKSKLTEIGLVSSNCADTPLTWSMSDFNAFI